MPHPHRRGTRAIVLCAVALVFFTFLDLWTKQLAVEHLPCDPATEESCRKVPGKRHDRAGSIVLVDGYLDLSYAENPGAAFGMLQGAPKWVRASVFNVAALVFTSALMWMFMSGHGGVLFAWSVPLVVSGALGNMVDRWRLGYVVDFIRFHIRDGWEWPTFNVADCTIAVGAVLLLLDGMRRTGLPRAETSGSGGAANEAVSG